VGLNDTTLKDLMDRALAYADFPKDSLDADQQKTLINDINDGLIELWEALIDSHEDLVHKIATLTLVSNTEGVQSPLGFLQGHQGLVHNWRKALPDGALQPRRD
jgi:hypothetical protein